MKKFIYSLLLGISLGCTIFVLMGIIFSLININDNFLSSKDFIRQAICSMITGIGFTLPSMIYKNEKVSKGLKVLFHMGIGLAIYFSIAFYAGWIPVKNGLFVTVLTVIIAIFVSFIIWASFYMIYKNDAKKMNQKIKDMER